SADLPVDRALKEARVDATLAIGLGGLITLAIMSTAATAFFGQALAVSPALLADALAPVLGGGARVGFAMGLLAAGLTSAITAPLAAAYAVSGAFGWTPALHDPRFRMVWAGVLATGTLFAVSGRQPLATILFAQAANGLLLPIVAIALLWVMNRGALLGPRRNGWRSNLAGGLVIAVTLLLGASRLGALFTA
ncbi:MAG: divalent metal cation transporter, partial [Pseudomonadales bacterium]|nr:divalent metal cation transporter [Pseudomonadales bacterium]